MINPKCVTFPSSPCQWMVAQVNSGPCSAGKIAVSQQRRPFTAAPAVVAVTQPVFDLSALVAEAAMSVDPAGAFIMVLGVVGMNGPDIFHRIHMQKWNVVLHHEIDLTIGIVHPERPAPVLEAIMAGRTGKAIGRPIVGFRGPKRVTTETGSIDRKDSVPRGRCSGVVRGLIIGCSCAIPRSSGLHGETISWSQASL